MTLHVTALSSPTTTSDTECSNANTEILSSAGTSPLLREQWPDFFDIPNFSVDVAYRLRQGDLAYSMKDGTRTALTRDMKHDILEKLAKTMYSYKAYPEDNNFSNVAKALISKHPGLTEPGPQPGWYGWKNSLKFKMANYRTKLRKAGCEDVSINGGKRSKGNPEGDSSSKNIKRPKRGEANYLPNLPEGHDETSLENDRQTLVEEMKKRRPNGILISKVMDQTFPLRRQEIVKNEPEVKNMVERWPALFTERQVGYNQSREARNITCRNINCCFVCFTQDNTNQYFLLVRKWHGLLSFVIRCYTFSKLEAYLNFLCCIPIIVGDDSSEFYKTCLDSTRDEVLASVTVGVLMFSAKTVFKRIQAQSTFRQSPQPSYLREESVVLTQD
uniref:uncharacterized protein LOC131105724 n=1 Tax=Doryrhamphus excisus TaxID=161450 RepID=UPI0025AE4E19|nr:uncharacterized protein LOC131105724 [Doryrhamphus excisus]